MLTLLGSGQSQNYISTNLNFEFSVNTQNISTGSSQNNQFKLPLVPSFNGVASNVDWGDGTSSVITAFDQAEVTHTYTSSGTYTVKISAALRSWAFNNSGDRLKITNISKFGIFEITEQAGFFGCSNLTISATDAPLVSSDSLFRYFMSCSKITRINGDLWNFTNVVSFIQMLDSCLLFNESLASWDIRNGTEFTFFAIRVTLSTDNYDATLISWNNQIPKTNVTCDFGNSKYSLGAASIARTNLIVSRQWTITDGGIA
jgi:hypothetical protein